VILRLSSPQTLRCIYSLMDYIRTQFEAYGNVRLELLQNCELLLGLLSAWLHPFAWGSEWRYHSSEA
jgi:hypothetical protein